MCIWNPTRPISRSTPREGIVMPFALVPHEGALEADRPLRRAALMAVRGHGFKTAGAGGRRRGWRTGAKDHWDCLGPRAEAATCFGDSPRSRLLKLGTFSAD